MADAEAILAWFCLIVFIVAVTVLLIVGAVCLAFLLIDELKERKRRDTDVH